MALRERRIAEPLQECLERGQLVVGHFEAGEHAAEVGAVIAVVEQADVPAAAELLEKLRQRARAARGTRTGTAARRARRGARPPTMWRTCSLAISLSVRSTVS